MINVKKQILVPTAIFGLALLIFSGCTTEKKIVKKNTDGTVSEHSNHNSGHTEKVPPASDQAGVPEVVAASLIKKDCDPVLTTKIKDMDSKLKAGDGSTASKTSAYNACVQVQSAIKNNACNVIKVDIVNETKIATPYDEGRVYQKCKSVIDFARQNGVQQPPIAAEPVRPEPSRPVPTPTPNQPTDQSQLRSCSADETAKIKAAMPIADSAATKIKALGDNWKYDSTAISTAAQATKSCEPLIQAHRQSPCKIVFTQNDGSKLVKAYTGESLSQRCVAARTYFYEYVQNTSTLNFKNADLYLDLSTLSTKIFEKDYINQIQGCRVENKSDQMIDYSGKQMVLIKDSRGFESKMMVLETHEGLLISCYGLNIDGPFSKREVVKVLKDEGSDIRLIYKLK